MKSRYTEALDAPPTKVAMVEGTEGVVALGRIGSWRAADLQEPRPEAATCEVFGGWLGPRISVRQSNCPVVDVKPWDELLTSLNQRARNTFRRALWRAEADEVRRDLASVEGAEGAARQLVTLHREASQGQKIAPEYLTQGFEAHPEATGRRMTARGLGAVSQFWRDGEVIISHSLVCGRDFVEAYLQGAGQETLRRYQCSCLYIRDAMNVALSRNSRHFNLLRVEEPYKVRRSSRRMLNHRMILGRNPSFWGPYTGYHTLRSRAKRYADSEGALDWVTDARHTYRSLRHAATRYTDKDQGS